MLTTTNIRRGVMVPALMICLLGAGTDQSLAQGVTTTIALTGDALPEGNGDFSFFEDPPVLNGAGQAAFSASLQNTSGGETDRTGVGKIAVIDS